MVGDPLRFSESWIDAWNSHDLERILAHYEDDFLLESPYVVILGGEPSGRLRGKSAVRAYWDGVLRRAPDLRLDHLRTCAGVHSLAVEYVGPGGRLSVEIFEFGGSDLVNRTIALHAYP